MAATPSLLLALVTAWSRLGATTGEPDLQGGACESGLEQCASSSSQRVRRTTGYTNSDFEAGGVNLALWFGASAGKGQAAVSQRAEPFELYEDFNIEDRITGAESWQDLVTYRRLLQRPSLSFYVDKVARKRWLPLMGFGQPRLFVLDYAHELTASGEREEEKMAIMRLLPTEASYAAKPTHMSMTKGVWLVTHDADNGTTRFSHNAMQMTERQGGRTFDGEMLANSLARLLHEKADPDEESVVLRSVRPGVVIEELFTAVDDDNAPPLEFNIFTIWGRVWLAQSNFVRGQHRWSSGFINRSAAVVHPPWAQKEHVLPEWVHWSHLVDVAERLGAHKDMFRTDIFVGVPKGTSHHRSPVAWEDRLAAVQYVVSESEIHPTTIFGNEDLCEEGARLWIAGYRIGNYRLVQNKEVPSEFLATGFYAPSASAGSD